MVSVRAALLVLLSCASLAACGTDRASEGPADTSDASVRRLELEKVPADLRHLVPLAERWGIGDDVDRNAKVDAATPVQREELRAALEPFHSRITTWLDSFGQGAMTDEAAAFMYMQLAHEEMTAGPPR